MFKKIALLAFCLTSCLYGAEVRHITRIADTRANLESFLDARQTAITTDTLPGVGVKMFVYRDADTVLHYVAAIGANAYFSTLTCTTLNVVGNTEFLDNTLYILDNVTPTKKAQFDASGITAATTRTFVFPDANGTLVLLGANNKFTGIDTFTQQIVGKIDSAQYVNPITGFLDTTGGTMTGTINSTVNSIMTSSGSKLIYKDANFNSVWGVGSGASIDGSDVANTFLGYQVGDPTNGAIYNTGMGYHALTDLTTGDYNTAIGEEALENVTTGLLNTGIGTNAGQIITTGSYNTFLGGETDVNAGATSAKSRIAIGFNAEVPSDNMCIIGGKSAPVGVGAVGHIDTLILGRGYQDTLHNDFFMGLTAESGTNQAGNSFTIAGGKGTGTGLGGAINFLTGNKGASGTALNALTVKAWIDSFFNAIYIKADTIKAAVVIADSVIDNRSPHLYCGFTDSSVATGAVTQNVYYQITNTTKDLWQCPEAYGFMPANDDTIVITRPGDYILQGWVQFDGTNGASYQIGIYNVDKAAIQGFQSRVAISSPSVTTSEAPITVYLEDQDAGDRLIMVFRNTASTAGATWLNSSMIMTFLHNGL